MAHRHHRPLPPGVHERDGRHGTGPGDVERFSVPGSLALSAVLAPHHFHEHAVHEEFFKAPMRTRGTELADACAAIIGQLAAVT